MEWYKYGNPEGRYIGSHSEYDIYSGSISPHDNENNAEDKEYRKVPGEFTFMYGPATGGMMESVGVELTTPGELIRQSKVMPDFKKRSFRVRGLDVPDALLLIERLNGFHSASHSIAFISAIEDASGIVVDDGVHMARIFMLELERIRSNLEVMKRMCEPAGFGVPVNQIGYLREKVSRVISSATGHRFFFGANAVNSAAADFAGTGKKITAVKDEFIRIFEGLQESKIFLNRLQNNGITRNHDLTGPAARAAGIKADARLDSNTLPYGMTGFKPVIRDEKDSFGRFIVRGEEIIRSAEMLENLDIPAVLKGNNPEITASGEGAARVESPQGDLFYYVKLEEGKIDDVWLVSPSMLNIRAFEQSMAGNIFTDFHFNWESFGIWVSEAGVDFV